MAELSRRILAGEIVVGQLVELEGGSFEIEGFDPFGAHGRRVYVRTREGERLTIEIPAG
ncbi:MAG TPA: hypothetical protein VMN35_01305 [Gaiellaceae bacterium]|nr:hypothetical protein [Gaiellaceae bacterium]